MLRHCPLWSASQWIVPTIGTTPILLLTLVAALRGQDADEKPADKVLAERRLELMQDRVQQFSVTPQGDLPDFPAQFERKPIFRYDDPARGYVAAALWKLGAQGRPQAIISTELQPRYGGQPRIVYEYLSLTKEPFRARSPDYQWLPVGSAVEFKPIPNSPQPAETDKLRLVQMRAQARRFAAHEFAGKERCELRLLPQPIDRYTPSSAERADGALFILSFGTNPEAVLLIESDGAQWNFAIGRLAGATSMAAQIDEAVVWEVGSVKYGSAQPYTASNAPANIPGIGPDGSPLPAP